VIIAAKKKMDFEGMKAKKMAAMHQTLGSAVHGLAWGCEPGQAKLGHADGFMAALAWLGVLKSQSQATKPQPGCDRLKLFGGGKIILIW